MGWIPKNIVIDGDMMLHMRTCKVLGPEFD